MSQETQNIRSRREFLKNTSRLAAASALAGAVIPHVHAAESNTIQAALIGCGGRGTGAAVNAMSVKKGPVKLVAMADVFGDRLATSHAAIRKECGEMVDVPEDRRFVGFDGYQKAMDCLKPGDVAIFASPPAFRCTHFDYAIRKNLNVFMEKPTTVDGPTTRKMLALAEQSVQKNLKVGVGLMCRHSRARWELIEQIKAGRIGDIITIRSYRMHGPAGSFASGPKPNDISDLLYQIQRFHSFLWASGGCYSDFYIHNIDECSWMKGGWPIEAQGLGGRHYRGTAVDQNFDIYSVEHTFADGVKLLMNGRTMPGCHEEFASYIHGTKGMAAISGAGLPGRCTIYKGQNLSKSDIVWKSRPREPNAYQAEWDALIDAIRDNKPFNEAKQGAEASLVTSMGRMAAHTGKVVTYDEMLNCEHEFAPNIEKLTLNSPAPLVAGPDGKYPVPQPGVTTQREY